MLLLYSLLALVIASTIAWVELVTSKYPRTISLFYRKSCALTAYALIYGLIAFGFTLAYVPLSSTGALRFQTMPALESKAVAPNPKVPEGAEFPAATLLTAVMIGLSVKGLLHIRLFSLPSTGTAQAFPVGTETIVLLFEPWLLRTILIDESNAVSTFLDAKLALYPDLALVKEAIGRNLPRPPAFEEAERTALMLDVQAAGATRDALEIYLRAFGVATLARVFPDRPAPTPPPAPQR